MASDAAGVTSLSAAVITPIAQLDPELSEQTTRAVRGEITITWPFNSVAKTFAFILAESDVRLRRERGQVRVQLQGSGAKALAETGCGGGDELLISLDGVQWAKDELPARVPGARVDWQLQFSEKLIAQVKLCDANETKLVQVDHPDVDDSPPLPTVELTDLPEPETEPDLPILSPAGRPPLKYTEEFRSPAFIKRARVSYGSLFEDGLDIFEEDGGVRGRGRKRSRFTLESTAWRYSSQSRSPEPETQAQDRAGHDISPSSPPLIKPSMADGGSQTVDTDVRQSAIQPVGQQTPPGSNNSLPTAHSSVLLPEEANGGAALLSLATEHQKTPAIESYSLFGTYVPSTPTLPSSMPGGGEQATTAPLDPSMSLSDQVRFGFSHDPQLVDPSAPAILSSHAPTVQLAAFDRDDAYPDSYLDRPSNAEYPGLQPYASGPEQQDAQPAYQYALGTSVPVSDGFERSQWDIPAHGERYIPLEADHYSGDALVEDRTLADEQASAQPESMANIEVPAGFDSYGGHENQVTTLPEVIDVDDQSSDGDEGQPLVENEETYDSEDEVGVQDEDDAVYDEDGDEIEQGDYDQREYDAPSDDDEGSSEEEEEVEREVRERYVGNDAYGEEEEEEEYSSAEGYDDEEQGQESGDEEDEDEEYDESEEEEIPPSRPAQPTVPKAPVVISLLDSSDEEDDQPPPPPAPRPVPTSRPIPATIPVATIPVATFSQPSPSGDARTGSEPQTEAVSGVQHGKPPAEESPDQDQTQDQEQDSVNDISPVSYSQTQVIDFALRSDPSGGQPATKMSEVRDEATGPDTVLPTKEDILSGPAQAVSSTHAEADQRVRAETPQTSDHEPDAGIDREGDLEDVGDPMDQDIKVGGDLTEPDAATGQRALDGDVVMEDEQDDEASDEGLFARRPRSRTPVEKDPDYVDQPDDEIVEEEYEIDKVNDLAGLEAAAEYVESSPRPAAIHAAERTAEQLQEIGEEALEQDQQVPEAAGTTIVDHQEESDPSLPAGPADPEEPHDADASTTDAIEEHATTGEEPVEPDDKTEPQAPVEQEASSATEVVSRPPDPEVISPSVDPSTPHPDVLAAGSSSAQHRPVAPASPASPRDKSEPEQEERGAMLQPSPIEVQASNPAEDEDQQGDDEIRVAVQRPPGPFQEEEAETSELPSEPHEAGAAQEVMHEASPMAAELVDEDVVMGEAGDEGDQELGSVPSPSTQLWGEMGETESPATGKPPAATDGHANGVAISAADDPPADKVLPTSSPGPSSSQDVHEGVRRSSRRAKTSAKAALEELASQQSTQDSEQQTSQSRRKKATTPDQSIQFARQSLAAKRTKKAPEPIQSSPRPIRARSSSLQTTATTEDEADHSIALARASLASPSKTGRKSGKSATALKGELSKRLKSDLPECLSLKSLRSHLKKPITAVGIVTTQPSRPSRAKTGSRDWVMSFNITDVAIAPTKVVEVQFYRANKDSLPAVKPGDGILLQSFQVQAVASKDFGLRSINSSSWAVFDVEDGPPQIKGPPVEDYDQYSDYMETLKEWYRALGASATEKLEKANQEMSQEGSTK